MGVGRGGVHGGVSTRGRRFGRTMCSVVIRIRRYIRKSCMWTGSRVS